MQNAEVRALQTPATLCNRLERHAAAFLACSKQTPRLGVSTAC